MTIPQFQKIILSWYKKNKRDLPWRNTKNPYKIWVSEIMLQQTQVPRVIPKYQEFLQAFPSLDALAKAPQRKVLKIWSGLGYWRRALYLHQTAKILLVGDLVSHKTTKFPKNPGELEMLPGIGHYTARAIACFAFGNTEAFLDTNIRRVYLHFFFPLRRGSGQAKKVADKEILKIAQKAIDALRLRPFDSAQGFGETREWQYALFDYGAMVLKDKTINKQSKRYHKQSKFQGSFRSFRAKTVRFLLASPGSKISQRILLKFLRQTIAESNVPYTPKEIISALLRDGILKKSAVGYSL